MFNWKECERNPGLFKAIFQYSLQGKKNTAKNFSGYRISGPRTVNGTVLPYAGFSLLQASEIRVSRHIRHSTASGTNFR